MAIWIVQWVGPGNPGAGLYRRQRARFCRYYVSRTQVARGWGQALCFLPHDGVNANSITGKKYKDHLGGSLDST